MPILESGKLQIDFTEAGAGEPVVLVHSSVSGNRQWKRLVQDLQPHYRVIALNLFGYGETTTWKGPSRQTMADQAGLVLKLVADFPGPVRLVGHSFGGSVACQAATLLGERVSHLCLFEPTLFHLLAQNGRHEAYAEAMALRDFVRRQGGKGHWAAVAEYFVDFWLGAGAWAEMAAERQLAYMQLLRPNYHEWDSVDSYRTTLEELDRIRARVMMVYSPDARRPSREIAQLFREQCPDWSVVRIADGGHMAPLTHPEVVNPLICGFLGERRPTQAAAARQDRLPIPCVAGLSLPGSPRRALPIQGARV